uniref:site-specific DNA-methyltransferase (cytosine-N(4)-specific) n=1 Tax=Candidatus Kentrum sp. SD TaxID=2126332 RepID=A0A451BI38_9GAMM|nr:MAG: Methyltransferase domain-containing protein [Candidatus Kentron sp. SD]
MLSVNSPKRKNKTGGRTGAYWDDYYPGYSEHFTREIIRSSGLDKSSLILDPWNGSGTSTWAASRSGFRSIGIDLNPVMKIIALARQATIHDAKVMKKCLGALKFIERENGGIDDPLGVWFDKTGVMILREVENGILGNQNYPSTREKIDSLAIVQCLMYVALFNVVRDHLRPFTCSNPTWIKKPGTDTGKISLDWVSFETEYRSALERIMEKASLIDQANLSGPSKLYIESSSKMSLRDEYVDLILTSPPYCTRIDYGIATLPELSMVAVGGIREIDAIRRDLMGATTVPKETGVVPEGCGRTCIEFLERVKTHPSKASRSYYHKNLARYFSTLRESVSEIARVLKRGCRAVCVVQDSFYKDIHCDLSGIVTDMAELSGLRLVGTKHFKAGSNMANVNTSGRNYRAANTAFETVLTLEK